MTKHVEIIYTTDEYDCECCGGSYAEAYQITCGDTVIGGEAKAHCFGGYSNELSAVLLDFLEAEGYTLTRIDKYYTGEME